VVSTRATGTFTIDTWDAQPYEELDGVALTRTRVTKTFSGDVVGTSTAELPMAGTPTGSAAYVGFERISASVHGQAGTFVLHHNATAADGAQSASWTVVPDCGTGGLRGLRGTARIAGTPDGGHTFTLDYELAE
jgi:uncharacterized protein DUF3224